MADNKIKNTKKFTREIFGATKIIDFRGFEPTIYKTKLSKANGRF